MTTQHDTEDLYMTCRKDGHEVKRRFHVEVNGGTRTQVPQLYEGEQVFYSIGSNVPEIVQGQVHHASREFGLQHEAERLDPGMYGGW